VKHLEEALKIGSPVTFDAQQQLIGLGGDHNALSVVDSCAPHRRSDNDLRSSPTMVRYFFSAS
jgi:hypothetical protein